MEGDTTKVDVPIKVINLERVKGIMDLLAKTSTPLTINEIADKFNVSNKTIRNDMVKVQEYLEGKGLSLDKRPGVGVSIDGSEEKKLALINETKTGEIIEPFSPQDRVNYILKRLFMIDRNVTIRELADELYVSRVTVHKDLENVEGWLKKFNLELIKRTNYGIEVSGSEENWRNAVASLIALNKENEKLKELLYEDYSGRIDYKTLTRLKELINLDYRQLEKIVANAESKLKFKFSDEAFISFIIHIAISIKRLRQKKDIHLAEDIMKSLREKEEFQVARNLASDINETFKVKLPESEIGYILLHILGAKMQENKEESMSFYFKGEENELSVTMAGEIVSMAEKALNVKLKGDTQLMNGLMLHLRPTINRLKYGLSLRNPILSEIKENYPEIYGAAWITSTVFEKYMGIKINEEEIGYIALHLAAAVERQKKPLRALVVCTSGIGTSQLLAARLEKHFRQIEIKEVMSLIDLKHRSVEDIDIIISTVPVEVEKPIICISPILTQNDLKRLDVFINDINNGVNNEINSVKYLLREEFIEVSAEYKDREEVIRGLSEKLLKKGYIEDGYIESALQRESITSTEVGQGAAIPHGSPEYVNQAQIAVAVLKEPIKWNEEMVDIVFLICITDNDLKKSKYMFRNIYNKIDSTDFLIELRRARSGSKIIECMEGINNVNR